MKEKFGKSNFIKVKIFYIANNIKRQHQVTTGKLGKHIYNSYHRQKVISLIYEVPRNWERRLNPYKNKQWTYIYATGGKNVNGTEA